MIKKLLAYEPIATVLFFANIGLCAGAIIQGHYIDALATAIAAAYLGTVTYFQAKKRGL